MSVKVINKKNIVPVLSRFREKLISEDLFGNIYNKSEIDSRLSQYIKNDEHIDIDFSDFFVSDSEIETFMNNLLG